MFDRDKDFLKNVNNEEVDNPKVEEDVSLIGMVVRAAKLNVRKGPSVKTESIDIIEEGTLLIVDEKRSSNDFYRVTIDREEKVVEGYCMKKFIEIQS